MKAVHRRGTERETPDYCQGDHVLGFHDFSPYVQNHRCARVRTVVKMRLRETRNYRSKMMPADGMSAAAK
jgi:hypothetical protein